MLGEITTFLLGMILAGNATKDVFIFHTEKMTWMEARSVCSRDGGSLASDYNQKDFIDLMTNITYPVWIGNYYSPWAWLLGCYSYTTPRDYIEFKANQMKECLNHCHKTNYFGLQNRKCFCFDTFQESPLETFSYCENECPGNSDERCGGKDAMTIYMNDICYENSAMWQGTVSQTWSGKQCLPWANIEEVKSRIVKYFPDGNAENASNYCRNPFGKSQRPWCYVKESVYENCDIPPCIKAAKDGIYPCMSFKKPYLGSFQFTQEDCQNEHYAICTNDNFIYWNHNKRTRKFARHQCRWYFTYDFTIKCKSLAGPQIFWLKVNNTVENSHWFGFFREVYTESNTAPNKMPTKCFSLSKKEGNVEQKVDDCDNSNNFICQYMAVTCGDNFNNSMNGSLETPGYNNSVGYGDFQRCVWNIDVPENHKISLLLVISVEDTHKCNSDVLQVFENIYESGMSFCGAITKTLNTTGKHVTIEFRSDGTENHYRGVQVEWSAVALPTLPSKPSTNKINWTTEHFSAPTTQITNMTTVQKAHADAETDSSAIADNTLVGVIVGISIGLCFVLGIALFCAKRRKTSKNKVNDELDSTKKDENIPAIVSSKCNAGNNKRPSSEIYQNAVTESEHSEYSLPNNVRENAVAMNSVCVNYQKKNGKDGCARRSSGKSDVYNTLHETTESFYQNHTENVYNHFIGSKETLGHAETLVRQEKIDAENFYNHLNDPNEAFGHAATLSRQGTADAEIVYNHLNDLKGTFSQSGSLSRQRKADTGNVYNHLKDSAETYDHSTNLTRQSNKAGATVASDTQTYDHLLDDNESTYDVTSM